MDFDLAGWRVSVTNGYGVDIRGDGASLSSPDNSAAIQRAIDRVAASGGGTVYVPPGEWKLASPVLLSSGVALVGESSGTVLTPSALNKSSVLSATASMGYLVGALSCQGASIRDLTVDGNDLAVAVVKLSGYQNRIAGAEIKGGGTYGIWVTSYSNGHENNIVDCLVSMNGVGTCVYYDGTSGPRNHDNLLLGCTFRGGATAQLVMRGSSSNQVVGCHFYGWPSTTMANNVVVEDSQGSVFVGNYFDGGNAGALVVLAGCEHVGLIGNTFLAGNSTMPDSTLPAILLDGSTDAVVSTVISGNTCRASNASRLLSAFVESVGDVTGSCVVGNVATNAQEFAVGPCEVVSGNVLDGSAVAALLAAVGSASRPTASASGVGAMVYDTTLGRPIWSNGSVWKDAAGTTV